jgi:hypothetical protein
MTRLEDIKIYPYLTPDPFDDESGFEEDWISWLPGYKTGETEDGEPSIYHGDNFRVYEKIENYISGIFRSALTRIWPLLEGIYFKQIQIAIDFTDFKNSSALAGYDTYKSDPARGIYVFHVDQTLLNRYLHFFQGNEQALPDMNLWEHELIHLIDHWQLVQASSLCNSNVPQNNLEYYLLKYRSEGLANLFDLLDGKLRKFKCRAEAKERLISNYNEIQAKIETFSYTTDQMRKELYSGYDFYEIGPWILLDMLDEIFFLEGTYSAEDIEQKIKDGVILSDEDKLSILEKAFLMDNEWFLGRLKME